MSDYSLDTTSIVPIVCEMLVYETINVAYNWKRRICLAFNDIFGTKLAYDVNSAYGLQYH